MKNNARVAAKASGRSPPTQMQKPRGAKAMWARVYALVSQISRKDWVVYVALSLGMFALGYILRPSGDHHVAPAAATASVRAKAGPWGDLEVTPIAISAPDEYLSVERVEKTPTRWIFKNRSRDDLARYFDSLELSTEQK